MGICLRHVKQLYVINTSSLMLSLYVVQKGVGEKTHQVMDSPIHGKHNGARRNSVLHCVCKLQSFL